MNRSHFWSDSTLRHPVTVRVFLFHNTLYARQITCNSNHANITTRKNSKRIRGNALPSEQAKSSGFQCSYNTHINQYQWHESSADSIQGTCGEEGVEGGTGGTYIGQRVVDGARGGPAQSLQHSFAELSGRRFTAVVHLCNHVSKSLLGSLRFFSAIGPGPDEETGCDLWGREGGSEGRVTRVVMWYDVMKMIEQGKIKWWEKCNVRTAAS
jgi:hypothetical protein